MSKARLEAFSDGVFAVAITLLVLEIAVPGEQGDLPHEVGRLWPSFAGYVVSFLTIGIIWVNHHTMVTAFTRLDRTTLFLNLNLLLWVVLIPWSTALIAEHLRDTGSDEHFAAAVYAGNFFVMGVSFFLLWRHAGRAHLMDVDPTDMRRLVRRNTVGEAAYLVAIGVAFLSATASLVICGLVAVYYIHPGPLRL
ncbi:MAG TPA: TMEM175 family protein [Solirubrobacteraceae bacterium]|nr:TMEM175 family protein [Solirubrobacteraceae bacterium]